MNRDTPLIARLLLRIVPLGARRSEVEADLVELFVARAAQRRDAVCAPSLLR